MAPRETENNDYAKFWGDKQRALWYVMVFSGVVNIELTAVHCFLDRRFKRRFVPDQKVHGHESLRRKNKLTLKWQRKLKKRTKQTKKKQTN